MNKPKYLKLDAAIVMTLKLYGKTTSAMLATPHQRYPRCEEERPTPWFIRQRLQALRKKGLVVFRDPLWGVT